MSNKIEAKSGVNEVLEYKYLGLLDDSAPKYYSDYNVEAQALKKQIDNPDVCNIAIVAKYGAGKSSVINTYLHNYRRRDCEVRNGIEIGDPRKNKYVKVTLSTFNNEEYDETAIERSVLQQLLYSRTKKELPNSEIKRTNRTSKLATFIKAVVLLIFAVSLLFFFDNSFRDLVFKEYSLVWKYIFLSIGAILFVLCGFYLLYYKKLKRVKFKDFEVEAIDGGDKAESKLINKFIDEVLYFFECIDINLVIFEDLDRLNTTKIFVKLRELNTIINNNKPKNKKVTFLYAVKDDLFETEEERAKFFEFILPVVPVINPVTTSDKLREQIQKCAKINDKLSLTEKFIKSISAYIPDMRILKNTLNDYIIMFSKIFEDSDAKTDHLKVESLFALSLYKNLFPYDYSLLENNNGLIPRIVNIDRIRNKQLVEINEKLNKAYLEIEKLNNEKLQSIKELKYMFIGQLWQFQHGSQHYNSPDDLTVDAILRDSFKFESVNYKKIVHPKYTSYYIKLPDYSSEIITENGESYVDREKLIIERTSGKINELKIEIAQLEQEKQNIKTNSFSDTVGLIDVVEYVSNCVGGNYESEYFALVGRPNVTTSQQLSVEQRTVFHNQFEQQVQYLQFLLANNYIDENYIEYTSNYKAQLISREDSIFISKIQRRSQDFDYAPNDIATVIRRLDDADFKHYSIINKTLLDKLELIQLIDGMEYTSKYENIIELLAQTTNKKVYDVIEKYLILSDFNAIETFLRVVLPANNFLCEQLITHDKLEKSKVDFIVSCVVKYAKNYKEHNSQNVLVKYVEAHNDYLVLFKNCEVDKSCEFIDELNPKFENLLKTNINSGIQEHVINNSQYVLSLDNIKIVFSLTDENDAEHDFYLKHLSFIYSSKKESVINYINQNINTYSQEILLNPEITLLGEPSVVIEELLKNDNVDISTKKELVKKCNLKVEQLSDFATELYQILIADKKASATWANIVKAYSTMGFDENIKQFISVPTITGSYIITGDNEQNVNAFKLFIELIITDSYSSADFYKVFEQIDVQYTLSQIADKLTAEGHIAADPNVDIIDEHLAIAIESNCVLFDYKDLTKLVDLPLSLATYVHKFETEINEKFDVFFECVLSTKTQQRVSVNYNYQYKDIYTAKSNSNKVLGIIIGSTKISVTIKKLLIEKCVEIINISGHEQTYANYFINEKLAVPTKILWQFTNVETVTISQKKTLLLNSVQNIDFEKERDSYKAYFKTLGDGWADVYDAAKEVLVEQTEENELLLEKLHKKGLLRLSKSRKVNNKLGYKTLTIKSA